MKHTSYSNRPNRIHGLWLLFAQAVTLISAVVFVLALISPGLRFDDDRALINSLYTNSISLSEPLKRVLPSIVSIKVQDDENNPDGEYSVGSGVIVSSEGYILTNHHVVSNAKGLIVITNEGENLFADIVGTDSAIDLALLKVTPKEPMQEVQFSSASNPLQVGDLVMSVGSPYGLAGTASLGIVSAIGRSSLGLSRYEHFIQTDAAINHGSSGGALTNTDGELVGISTALFSSSKQGSVAQGIGFAIPSELARVAYEQILTHGRFKRGWIGLGLVSLNPLLDQRSWLDAWKVKKVDLNSPADKAGIEVGDLIMSIDGRSPSQITFIEEATGELLQPGKNLEVGIDRDENIFTVTLAVIEQ